MSKKLLSLQFRSVLNLLLLGIFLMGINHLLYASFPPVWSAIYIIVVPSVLTILTILYSIYILFKGKFFSQFPTLTSVALFLGLVFALTYPIFNTSLFRQAIVYMQGTCRALSNNTSSNLIDALPCILQSLSYWIALPLVLCGLPIFILTLLKRTSKTN